MNGAVPSAGNFFPNPPMNMPEPAFDPEGPVVPPIPTSHRGRMGTPYVAPRPYDSPSSDDDLTDSLDPEARERLQPRLAPGQYGPYDPIRNRNRTPAPALRRDRHGHRRAESSPSYHHRQQSPFDDRMDEPPVIPPHPAGGQPFQQQQGFVPHDFGMSPGMDDRDMHQYQQQQYQQQQQQQQQQQYEQQQQQRHQRHHHHQPEPEPIRPRPFEPIQRSHNPLPPPPRDIFQMSPYARVLRELRKPIDENAILGGAAAIHTVGAINIGGAPGHHHQGTRSSKEKKRKGLFRSLSHRLGSRRSEDEFEAQQPQMPGQTFVGGTSTAVYPIVQHMPDGSTQLIYNPPVMPVAAMPVPMAGAGVVPPPGVMPGYVPAAAPAAGGVNPPPPVIPQGSHVPQNHGHGHGHNQTPVFPPGPAPTPIPVLQSPGPARMPTPQPAPPPPPVIKITHGSNYAGLLHMSPHRVHYQHRSYPTGMHLLEAMKFLPHRPDLAEQIRNCGTPEEAVAVASGMREFWKRDWEGVALDMMEEVLYQKFIQHPQLRALLMSTGNADLVFSDPDTTWGDGQIGQGMNWLGHALMRVRSRFREEGLDS
ncbi:DUF1768-domain-containing protein [Lentinus brumalis]|uniref:DUF1768-domain-containing protein n=1 Tax=Lentinus brumalis TaxID=2498619 RepID=A0A371DRU8_9APHY|nr:DUF1768-domain-containing protein [Polyporus brumalis]